MHRRSADEAVTPGVTPNELLQLRQLQQLQQLQQLVDEAPVHRQLELRVSQVEGGKIVLDGRSGEPHLHGAGPGITHGGIVATLLDAAATFALIALTGEDWSTVDLRVDYLRPLPAGLVTVSGEVVHAGSRLGRARAAVVHRESGRECAIATGTFARATVTSAPPATPANDAGAQGPGVPSPDNSGPEGERQ